jgi:hypothetical protein
MRTAITAAAFALLAAGCSTDQVLLQTQSGYPEATFYNTSPETVENKLVGACSRVGAAVTDTSPHQVVCGKTLEGQTGVLAQALLGNAYSTTPVENLRFVLYATGSSVHVTAYHWVETQTAFGQVRKAELNGTKQRNDLQLILYKLSEDNPSPVSYSPESRIAVASLTPENPNAGVGKTYSVSVPVCDVRSKPDNYTAQEQYRDGGYSNPVIKQYRQGTALRVYARDSNFARVSPDGSPPEWVPFSLLQAD